jgi:hypothetical protein
VRAVRHDQLHEAAQRSGIRRQQQREVSERSLMKTRLIPLSLLAGVLAVSSPALAHHGNAAYDGTIVVIKGATVTKLAWANPHTLVQFDVKDDKGELVHWVAELGSPSALGNIGWNKNSLRPGDVITVYINQAKTKNPVGRIDHIVLADGSELRDSGGGANPDGGAGGGRGGRGGGRGGAEPQ